MAGYLEADWSLCGRYVELQWSYRGATLGGFGADWGLIGNTVETLRG